MTRLLGSLMDCERLPHDSLRRFCARSLGHQLENTLTSTMAVRAGLPVKSSLSLLVTATPPRAEKVRPKEEHRLLGLDVLQRIADRANSELAGLWHEGSDGAQFDAAPEHLRSRLQAASEGPRELPKPKVGDVITLLASPTSAELVVVQVVGSGEVAVFEGTCTDEKSALDCVETVDLRAVCWRL
jgi:hypothetical protein